MVTNNNGFNNAPQGDVSNPTTLPTIKRIAGVRNTRLNLDDSHCDLSKPVTEGVRAIIDYSRFSTTMPWREYRKLVRSIVDEKFIEYAYNSPRSIGSGIKKFDHTWKAPHGVLGFFNIVDKEGNKIPIHSESDLATQCPNYYVQGFISMPGQYWSNYRLLEQWGVFQVLNYYYKAEKICCTRLDVAIDDFGKKLNMAEAIMAVYRKDTARFQNGRAIVDMYDGEAYTTVYCGSRESDKFYRIYETKPVHDFDAIRLEGEFKGDYADVYFRLIANFLTSEKDNEILNDYGNCYPGIVVFHDDFVLEAVDHYDRNSILDIHGQMTRLLTSIACGHIDFIDRDSIHKNGSLATAKKLEWWSSWLSYVNTCRIRITLSKERTPFNKTAAWFSRSTAKFLHKVSKSIGIEKLVEVIKEEIDKAGNRLDRIDLWDIQQLKTHGVEALFKPT